MKAIVTSDSEAHLNKPKLLFYEDFHFRMWIFTRRHSKLRTINNSGVQRSQTSGRTTYHRSTTYWTSILNFTITQSEMVNQLPHTNMRCELNTQLGVHLTISHIRFCKPALIATRLRDRCCYFCRINSHYPGILVTTVFSQLCELFLQFSYTRSGRRLFSVNFLFLTPALVSPYANLGK